MPSEDLPTLPCRRDWGLPGLRRLDVLTEQLLGKPLADLSRADAAVLIQTLKNIRSGAADLAEILEDHLP